jgi:hypothetical protein
VRLILFLASAMTAGAVGVTQGIIPLPAQVMQAIFASGGDPAHLGTGSRVEAYRRVLPQIIRGTNPEDPALHGAEVAFPPGSVRGTKNGPVNLGAIGQSGLASAMSQIQQNNSRMQDMAAFAHDPSDWHGAPQR